MLPDALGSIVAETNSSQIISAMYAYDPYGNTSVTSGVGTTSQQYTGRENDGTGLYYYRARYYDLTIDRFIAEDPIGFSGGPNVYAYVRGNPISFIDPLGLLTWQCIASSPEGIGYTGSLKLCNYRCNTTCPRGQSISTSVAAPGWNSGHGSHCYGVPVTTTFRQGYGFVEIPGTPNWFSVSTDGISGLYDSWIQYNSQLVNALKDAENEQCCNK